MNPMRVPRISKVTVNMGVGEGGEKLEIAENLLKDLTGQQPVRLTAKESNQTFAIRKGLPIACKVTLRGQKADDFLKKALYAVDNRIKKSSFDQQGNLSFGIDEHINLPDVKYDPKVGIWGMDVSVTMERPGYRIKRRKIYRSRPGKSDIMTREDAFALMEKKGATLEE
jgi:large subunit ribosomal protein L5